jgi:hypothetical protein
MYGGDSGGAPMRCTEDDLNTAALSDLLGVPPFVADHQ